MSFYPPIPIQFRLYGEIPLANEFIANGRKLAGKLNEEMSRGAFSDFGDNDEEALDIARKGPVRYKGDYGIVDIECFITHGVTYVTIKTYTTKEKKKGRKELCPVYPCFVPATIEKVSCLDPDISIGDPCVYEEKLRTNEFFFYDVSFCLVDKKILLENYQVTSAGWEVYKKGQRVMLGPSARWSGTKTWDCCADKKPFGEELLNPETFKLRYGYLEVYPISVSTTLDGQIIKPAFPPPKEPEDDPDEYYKYQASVCFSHERLSNMCVQKVAIAGITDDDNYRNVTVIYDGFFYYNVPVWIHTDIGTRKREIIQEDPISAESFFDDAALFFPVPEGEYDIEHEILDVFGYPSAPPTAQTYPPAALALVENGVPIGVISVVRSANISKFLNEIIPPTWHQRFAVFLRDYKYVDAGGIYDAVTDPGTGRTYWRSRITGEKLEFLDHKSFWVIYDENGVARIPNSDKTELVRADARVDPYVNDYIETFTEPYLKILIISKLDRWPGSIDPITAGGLSIFRAEVPGLPVWHNYAIFSHTFTYKGVDYTVERVAGNGSVQVSVQQNSSSPVFSDGYTPCSDNRIWARGREMVYSCRNAYVDAGVFLLGVDSIGCPNGGGSVFIYKYNTASEDLNSILTKSINSIISELNNYTPNVSVVYFDLDDDPEVDDLDGPYGYPDYMYISAISYFITPYDIANCDLPLAV